MTSQGRQDELWQYEFLLEDTHLPRLPGILFSRSAILDHRFLRLGATVHCGMAIVARRGPLDQLPRRIAAVVLVHEPSSSQAADALGRPKCNLRRSFTPKQVAPSWLPAQDTPTLCTSAQAGRSFDRHGAGVVKVIRRPQSSPSPPSVCEDRLEQRLVHHESDSELQDVDFPDRASAGNL
jgi:hypothetical protein